MSPRPGPLCTVKFSGWPFCVTWAAMPRRKGCPSRSKAKTFVAASPDASRYSNVSVWGPLLPSLMVSPLALGRKSASASRADTCASVVVSENAGRTGASTLPSSRSMGSPSLPV